jgi:hypothetical protein
MATEGKIRNLELRPKSSAEMSFNMPGIIGMQSVGLGDTVTRQNLVNQIYPKLDTILAAPDEGRHEYDSTALASELDPLSLLSLRNHVLSCDLNQAITRRQTAFLERYKHIPQMHQAWKDAYPERVRNLENIETQQTSLFNALDAVYKSKRPGVIEPKSEVKFEGQYVTETKSKPTHHLYSGREDDEVDTHSPGESKKKYQIGPYHSDSGVQKGSAFEESELQTIKYNGGIGPFKQTSVQYTDDFREMVIENSIRHSRSQADVINELLQDRLIALKLNDLDRIWTNELHGIDLEVKKLQYAFCNTYIVSPIDGVVTAIYKSPGESVDAGEPVIRVEDPRVALLVGVVKFQAGLLVGSEIHISMTNIYDGRKPGQMAGKVVALRGHEQDNDEWDVVIECPNNLALPINYHFERDAEIKLV